MRYTLYALLMILFLLIGCTEQDQEVVKETAEGTAKDVVETTKTGIEDLAKDIGYAAPDIKDDIIKAFWDTAEALDILIYGESVEDIPTPGDIAAMQYLQGIGRGVVRSKRQVQQQEISEPVKAFELLADILNEEIRQSQVATTETIDDVQQPVETPSPQDIHDAWIHFSKLANTPDKARDLFMNIKGAVENNPDMQAVADTYGPIAKSKIGNVANEFVSNLKIGEVSSPINFKKGILLVQLIDDTNDMVEVGYVYIPLVTKTKIQAYDKQ